MNLQELIKKRAAILEKLNGLTAKVDSENRDFTSDEEKQFDEGELEVKSLNKKIDREQRARALSIDLPSEQTGATYEPASASGEPEKRQKATGEKGWRSFGEFISAVVRAGTPGGQVDPRLATETRAISGMSTTVSSDGGFLVGQDFSNELLKRAYDRGVLASRVRRIPIGPNSNGLKINAIDESSRADGSRFGGVQVYWASEAGTVTAKQPKFKQLEWNLHKLMGLCYLTDELMADATAIESVVRDAFAAEFAFKIDDAILRGDGSGKPLGILNSGALVTQTKESGQTATTVNKENIVKMRSRLWAPSRANSVWFINQDVEPNLNLLTLGDLGAYFPAGTFADQPNDRLFGRPVLPIEQASTLGTVGDISLLDLSEYVMIDKGGLDAQSSVHVRFIYDEMALRFTYRCDGAPTWTSALTPYKGSSTKSPFVTLETRS